jgi:acetate kinase
VCDGLGFLGVALDATRNVACAGDALIADERSRVAVLVIPARENWVLAQECVRVAAQA